ncbi:MAG: RHS repeat protein, partial [Gammaproteobacteria bacterium]|nr:RHS repeat protein [Gammaproteobacteria bacterium]
GNETTAFDYVDDYIETRATVTVTDEKGANPVNAVDHFCFDDIGYVSEHEDAEGYLTINTRNSDYRVTRKERWGRASNNAAIKCNTTTDTANRTLVNATDNSYDSDGRLLTETVNRGDGRTLTTTRTYDGAWVASEEIVSSDEPARIFRTEYTFFYDGNGKPNNIKTVTQKRDAGHGGDQTTTYAYNSRGQTVSITYADNTSINLAYDNGSLYPTRRYFKGAAGVTFSDLATINTYDTRGNLASVTDAAGKKTIHAYDARNRLINVTNPLGEQTILTYNENNLVQIEIGRTVVPVAPGEIQKRSYDGKNRLSQIQIQRTDGSWLTTATYAYDSRGRTLSVTGANSKVTRFGYDKLGRMTRQTDAKLSVTSHDYNALG